MTNLIIAAEALHKMENSKKLDFQEKGFKFSDATKIEKKNFNYQQKKISF